jgi:uncharacterized protein (UPF0276 family)
MLLENPSTYIAFAEGTYSEIDFIAEVARRTGCGLLLDVNNVHVASTNQLWDPARYIDQYPLAHVQEIHLAGRAREMDEKAVRSGSTPTTGRWMRLSGTDWDGSQVVRYFDYSRDEWRPLVD